ncbi:hypothetical protein WOLCODRAFT_138381 [Wolfiporia cocos MD-104 SS10]|uniref:Uncharacterized protein n=1 Tax=Wolfiporia cocos (strain MD-104) TaxID=742152 RepID=A0A2H3K512_WOLCO|nr:hypothetical protein WOLCODRAFT_138381 [Wolfiporia cocos MD-104 SS10]
MGPQAVLHAFKTNHLGLDVAILPEACFWDQKAAVVEIKALEQGEDIIIPQMRSPILRDWAGIYDRCSICKEDCALELWGAQDWPLLRTKIGLSMLSMALPGNLTQTDEPRQIMEYMSSPPVAGHGFVDYKPIVEDLIAIGPSACPRSLAPGPWMGDTVQTALWNSSKSASGCGGM